MDKLFLTVVPNVNDAVSGYMRNLKWSQGKILDKGYLYGVIDSKRFFAIHYSIGENTGYYAKGKSKQNDEKGYVIESSFFIVRETGFKTIELAKRRARQLFVDFVKSLFNLM